MANHKALVFSILRFLDDQKSKLPEDLGESIEVAQQCLESVYSVSLDDATLAAQCTQPLEDIFKSSQQNTAPQVKVELTQAQRDQAEQHKGQGNDLMKQEKFQEALVCYTQAIDIDNSNAVYFCNRAAAYSKMSQHEHALTDCARAIELDPSYSKAYGRKGLAHSALNQHAEAKKCYQKAMELDPTNQSYQQNLEVAEQKLQEMPAPTMGGLNMGGMDFSALLSNPALMNMATTMFQNPSMQNMMANVMGGAAPQGQPGPDGLGGLLQAGQALAQQMQQSNPDLVNQLRTQMRDQQGEPDPSNPSQ